MAEGDAQPPDPVAMLDELVGHLENEKTAAQRVLARAKGVEAERLFKAIAALDAKIAEARARREVIARRVARAARIRELAGEVHALRAEAEVEGLAPERRAELKARADAARAEAEGLVATAKRERGD